MSIKNPFDNIPRVIDEDPISHESIKEEETNELIKGNPSRTIFKSIASILVPIVFILILIWIFLDDPSQSKFQPQKEVTLDQSKQLSDTNLLMDKLRSDADKPAPANVKVEPAKETKASNPVSSMPQPEPTGSNPSSDKVALDKLRREEEIRSSPLEAGNLKLISSPDGVSNPFKSKAVSDIESEIAEVTKKKLDAAKEQESIQSQILNGALSKNEPAKAKSSNETFLQEQASATGLNPVAHQQASASKLILNQGSVIRSVLLTGVNSDLPGRVTAQVTSNVYDSITGKYILIPKGSKLNGAYNSEVVSGQSRLLIAMNRLILPNGTWISLAGTSAADMIGQSGINADVNNHFFKMFSTSLILGASTLLLPKDQNTISSTSGAAGTTTGGSIFGLALNDVLKTILDRNRSISPTLSLKYGDEFLFLAAQDMLMIPYQP